MALLNQLKHSWRELEQDPPGRRFQARYERNHSKGRSWGGTLVLIAGTLLLPVGIFLMPAPGPGILVVLAAGALLAQESLTAARVLDRAEVLARQIAAWAVRLWRRASMPLRVLIVVVGLALAVAAAWGAYLLLAGR